jgi:penicillin-binding protein 2
MSENREIRGRLGRAVVLILFGILLVNLFILQVPRHRYYREQALQNRQEQRRLKAPRGLIRDREGRILADNMYIADITLPVSCLGDAGPDSTLGRLMGWWHLPEGDTLERLAQQKERGRERLVLVPNAGMARIHAVEEFHHELPGVKVETRARRRYLYKGLFAHVIGYVGEVGQEDIVASDNSRRAYRPGDMKGVLGVEAACEDSLRGEDGVELVEINAGGRVVRRRDEPWSRVPPQPGKDVTLTLSVALQDSLRSALQGRRGCAVALSLPSGKVLAAYSSPTYDPNRLTTSISPREWERLVNDPAKPFFNRIVQATYPPGSLYKVVTSLCALQLGVIGPHSFQEPCLGAYRYGDRYFHCWKRAGHGSLDHAEALVQSCDIFYYQLGQRLTIDQLAAAARAFGLGRSCQKLFPEEVPGNIPTSAWYDRRFGRGQWTQGVMLNNAIGQGEILVTPLQVALLAAAIATSGRVGQPTFLRSGGGDRPEPFLDLQFSEEHLRWVRDNMTQVVDVGTGAAARLAGIAVAGKTGTAQNPHGDDHAWFMCYAPAKDPEVALAVILENAGHGGAEAAPVAGRWLHAYFAWSDAGEMLP